MNKRFLIPLMLSCIFTFNSQVYPQDPHSVNLDILGDFQGTLRSSGQSLQVQTSFFQEDSGQVSGTYVMYEEDGEIEGTLSEFQWEDRFVVLCRWTDKYGTGWLRMLFSGYYDSFSGYWGLEEDTTDQEWSGIRLNQNEDSGQ